LPTWRLAAPLTLEPERGSQARFNPRYFITAERSPLTGDLIRVELNDVVAYRVSGEHIRPVYLYNCRPGAPRRSRRHPDGKDLGESSVTAVVGYDQVEFFALVFHLLEHGAVDPAAQQGSAWHFSVLIYPGRATPVSDLVVLLSPLPLIACRFRVRTLFCHFLYGAEPGYEYRMNQE
jgi:hypothetical protein